MNNELTVPNVEQVKAREVSITLYVDMTLASIPVVVSGQYNVHSNCFYPSAVRVDTDMLTEDGIELGSEYDLQEFCKKCEWEYYDTFDLIRKEVEQRG